MGTISKIRAGQMPLLQARVQSGTYARVMRAAKLIDQPAAAWLRMAVMEKLERDGQ